jgi:hypothetical protein
MNNNSNTNSNNNSIIIRKVYDPTLPWIYIDTNTIPSELKIKQKLERINKKSAYGDVYRIGTDNKYVLKVMICNNKSDFNTFKNELVVGSIDGIEAVGPRIYAYLYANNIGEYIMDNILKGRDHHVLYSVYDYFMKVFGSNKCPSIRHIFYRKLRRTLIRFYNITKGYHGDLHSDNMMVVLDSNNKLLEVRIIDYGSHRTFHNTKESTCLESLFERIHTEWNEYSKENEIKIFKDTHVKYPPNSQPYRMNSQVLRSELGNTFMERLFKNKSKKLRERVNSSTKTINNSLNINNLSNKNNNSTQNNSHKTNTNNSSLSSRGSITKKYPKVS